MCGMYDTVKVDDSVPLSGYPDSMSRTRFQTKDLGRLLSVYRITEDRRLEERRRDYREKTDEEKQEYAEERDFESWDDVVNAYGEALENGALSELLDRDISPAGPASHKIAREWWHDEEYHGTLNFYTSVDGNLFEYDAKFTDGELVEITRLK